MIKTLDKLSERPLLFQRAFLKNCTIEEKMDAYYIIIRVVSPTVLKFYKRNMKPITNVDCILNKMYTGLMNDWYDMLRKNKDVFENNIGKCIRVFYLPVQKPITTTYKITQRYIIDGQHSDFFITGDNISVKKVFNAANVIKIDVDAWLNNPNTNIDNVFYELYDKSKLDTYADNPEGFVLRYGKGNIYQKIFNVHVSDTASSHFYYEFVIKDFIKFYMENINLVDDQFDNNYVNSVCRIFNTYIERWFSNGSLSDALDPNSLEPPFVGVKPLFNLDIIPNNKTKELCKGNVLYEQIFKILLVNLKNKKSADRCFYLSDNDVEFWNKTVEFILTIVDD